MQAAIRLITPRLDTRNDGLQQISVKSVVMGSFGLKYLTPKARLSLFDSGIEISEQTLQPRSSKFGLASLLDTNWCTTLWLRIGILCFAGLIIWALIWLRLHYKKCRMVALEKQVALRTQEFNHIILNLEQSEKQLKTHLNYQKDLNHSITHDISTPLHYLTTIIRNFFDRATNKEAIEAGKNVSAL